MDKSLLKDIKRRLFIRSALLSLSSLNDLLGLNDYLSADEILLEIIKKALREFEDESPLVLEMNIARQAMCTCYGKEGYCEIKSNFTLYLDCMIDESQIVLVPNSIPMYRIGSLSYPTASNYTYFSDYQRPYVFMGDVPTMDTLYIRGICSRPIIPDFLPDKSFNEDSDKAAVYWMNIEEGTDGNLFLDLCMVHLLDYIRQLKASLQLPNISVDVLANVDNAYMELRSKTSEKILANSWRGQLLI